jgi:F-type H+-transporting ATPase subunit b
MFGSTDFWVTAGFLILLALGGRKAWAGLTGFLDARAQRIREQLDEATRLRREAEAMLADAKRKNDAAAAEAKAILEKADEEAERVRNQTLADLDALLKRREELALARIGEAERLAIREVELLAVDIAMQATRQILVSRMAGEAGDTMLDQAIGDVETRLN